MNYCSAVNKHTTMNAYVVAGNNVSLAVKSMLQVKRAFKAQIECHEVLTRKNKSLQENICQLETRIKDLEKKICELESDKKKHGQIVSDLQQHIVSDVIGGYNGADIFKEVFVLDNNTPAVKVNFEDNNEALLCPTSPTTSNQQKCKRKGTPKKKSVQRKSRRISNRV